MGPGLKGWGDSREHSRQESGQQPSICRVGAWPARVTLGTEVEGGILAHGQSGLLTTRTTPLLLWFKQKRGVYGILEMAKILKWKAEQRLPRVGNGARGGEGEKGEVLAGRERISQGRTPPSSLTPLQGEHCPHFKDKAEWPCASNRLSLGIK